MCEDVTPIFQIYGKNFTPYKMGEKKEYFSNIFVLGVTQILAFFFFNTNMLVSPMQNSCVGGIAQRERPTRGVLHCSGI